MQRVTGAVVDARPAFHRVARSRSANGAADQSLVAEPVVASRQACGDGHSTGRSATGPAWMQRTQPTVGCCSALIMKCLRVGLDDAHPIRRGSGGTS